MSRGLKEAGKQARSKTGRDRIPTHPTYAVHLENTASLLERMGRTREAAELYRKALAIYEVNLGRDHAECQAVRASLRRLRSS